MVLLGGRLYVVEMWFARLSERERERKRWLTSSSETIARLVRKHESIVGVKLTCGSVAKITRLAAEFPAERFAVFGGQSDFLIGGLAVGSAGCIAAFANVFPKTIVQVYDLYKAGKTEEALALHRRAALAEQALKAGGIAATKYAASVFTAPMAGVEQAESKMMPRRPYLPPGEEAKRKIREALAEVSEIERVLGR
jgi:dihydrodipicolinate synthase/N-acetylneuraminate lyase